MSQTIRKMPTRLRSFGIAAALTVFAAWGVASPEIVWSAGTEAGQFNVSKDAPAQVEPAVITALAANEHPDVLVRFRGNADLSPAFNIHDRTGRAAFVYEALTDFADAAQSQVREVLQSQFGLSESNRGFTVLWAANSIAIPGLTQPVLDAVLASGNVESVRVQRIIPLPVEPIVESGPTPE